MTNLSTDPEADKPKIKNIPKDICLCCVIVAYRPDVARLGRTIRTISAELGVVVVSNADQPSYVNSIETECRIHNCACITLGRNAGIGYAQNTGIRFAMDRGAEYVLLLDDDSELSIDCIRALLHDARVLRDAGVKVAAVCARVVDRLSGEEIVYRRLRSGVTGCVPVSEMMSSGALIHRSVFDQVGLMDDSLFIDFVDWEWGWRARAAGYRSYVSPTAKIRHTLGIGVIRLFGLRIGLPTPRRQYYQFRNGVLMMTTAHVPSKWKLMQLVYLAAKPIIYFALADQRRTRLRLILRGMWDGIRGKRGPMHEKAPSSCFDA